MIRPPRSLPPFAETAALYLALALIVSGLAVMASCYGARPEGAARYAPEDCTGSDRLPPCPVSSAPHHHASRLEARP